jgi:hypothetical protein
MGGGDLASAYDLETAVTAAERPLDELAHRLAENGRPLLQAVMLAFALSGLASRTDVVPVALAVIAEVIGLLAISAASRAAAMVRAARAEIMWAVDPASQAATATGEDEAASTPPNPDQPAPPTAPPV